MAPLCCPCLSLSSVGYLSIACAPKKCICHDSPSPSIYLESLRFTFPLTRLLLERQRIVRQLVEKVTVYDGDLDISMRADGIHTLIAELRGGVGDRTIDETNAENGLEVLARV